MLTRFLVEQVVAAQIQQHVAFTQLTAPVQTGTQQGVVAGFGFVVGGVVLAHHLSGFQLRRKPGSQTLVYARTQTVSRNTREITTVFQTATHAVTEQGQPGRRGCLPADAALNTLQHRIGLTVFNYAVSRARISAGISGIDEVIDLIAVDADIKGDRPLRAAQAQLGVDGRFAVQIRVTQLDRAGCRVRAGGIQLFGGWQALRA